MTRSRAIRLLAILILASGFMATRGSSVLRSQGGPVLPPLPRGEKHTPCATAPFQALSMFVPLAHARFFGAADLMLNNRGVVVHDVVPTWYVEGRGPVVGDTIQLPAGRADFYDIQSVLPRGVSLSAVTGLELAYTGHFREVWAQAVLRPAPGAQPVQSLDTPFGMAAEFKGSSLETVWPATTRADRAAVAVANTSESELQVTLTHPDSRPANREEVRLAPHSGKLIEMATHTGAAGGADWLRLQSNGAPGALRALGFVLSARDRIPRLARFYDPAGATGSQLFATGLSVRNMSATVALRNIGDMPVNATVELLDVATADVLLSGVPVSLAAGGATLVPLDLSSLTGVERVSVRVQNTGGTGSVVAMLHATNAVTGLGYEMPLRDVGPARASTGSYPVRLDGDYETVVSVTNVGTMEAPFHARVHYGNTDYKFKPVRLKPGASATFNLRQLRDQQTPDQSGRRLPTTLDRGQFYWSTERTDGKFTGRAEVVSREQRVSSSFSCWMCCGDSVTGTYADLFGDNVIGIGITTTVGLNQDWEDCDANYMGNFSTDGSWSYNSGVVSLDEFEGDYIFTGVGTGSTTPTAAVYVQVWFQPDEYSQCEDDSYNTYVGTPGTTLQVDCAYPVNFGREASSSVDGVLYVQYNWQSSHGSKNNLQMCGLREYVTYSGGDPYNWPAPFPDYSVPNPTVGPSPPTAGNENDAIDAHEGAEGTFRTPYFTNDFSASQKYQYSCPCKNGGAWTDTWGPKTILREVFQDSIWKYRVSKEADSATKNLQ
jgi:hypothetical protein